MKFIKSPGIDGRIKQRIEDFIVEEIPEKSPPGDEYTIFWLEKFNWDIHRAIKVIAKKLHVSFKRFGFAGTKDKRALTKQRISVWKIEPDDLKKINIKDLKLYDFEKSSERINLGNLKGNKFTIIIRNIDLSKEEIEKRLNNIFSELKKGVPNLFGPQRFGEVRKVTYLVGKEMLKGRYHNAVKIYLSEVFEGEHEDIKEAREFLSKNWNQEGFKKALELFPKKFKYERTMLDYLTKHPNDYAGALRRLPKKLRKIFLNSVQAYIWNEITKQTKEEKIPLVGYNINLEDETGKKIKEIMKREDIKVKDFEMGSMPEMKCNGSIRNRILIPKELKLEKIFDDEYNKGKKAVKISFSLPSGSYATVILKEITD